MKPTNYVKLSIRDTKRHHDADAVPQAASSDAGPLLPHDHPFSGGELRKYVTTWIFPFVDELEADGRRALAAAEAKCEAVSVAIGVPFVRFRFTTYRPSTLGLDVVLGDDESEAA